MIEIIKILRVDTLGDFRLHLCFSDGTEGEWDFANIVAASGTMIVPLKDPKYFAGVFLRFGTPAWPNGFDLDSIALHDEMNLAGVLRRS